VFTRRMTIAEKHAGRGMLLEDHGHVCRVPLVDRVANLVRVAAYSGRPPIDP
jgi:hypothetical protein